MHTVQEPGHVVSEKNIRQVGSITSAERGDLVTLVYAINAAGNVIPPMFIFPRVNFRDHFIANAPNGSCGAARPERWINEELFSVTLLKHFQSQTRCSKDHPVLLILDNHESHIALDAIDFAKENGIVLLTIPPHTSHKLQPLDVSCFKPFKTAYNKAMDNWLRSHPGKTVTIYDIPELVKVAHEVAFTPSNVTKGFQSTGIFPFNSQIFGDVDFMPSSVSDRPLNAIFDEVADRYDLSSATTAPSVNIGANPGPSSAPTPPSQRFSQH